MSEVTGPISTLPGASHHVPAGTMCDLHPSEPAVARIQGETDSFGSELNDMCENCLKAHRQYQCSDAAKAGRVGNCDWCKKHSTDLRNARDYDEGMHGPVYQVCGLCVQKQNDEAEEYLRSTDAEFDYGDEWP